MRPGGTDANSYPNPELDLILMCRDSGFVNPLRRTNGHPKRDCARSVARFSPGVALRGGVGAYFGLPPPPRLRC